MKNFKLFEDNDFGSYKSLRELKGRVTKNRIKIVNSFIERYNNENRYPYGEGYSCGHVHDCCGCLTSTYMTIEATKKTIKIYLKESYNY